MVLVLSFRSRGDISDRTTISLGPRSLFDCARGQKRLRRPRLFPDLFPRCVPRRVLRTSSLRSRASTCVRIIYVCESSRSCKSTVLRISITGLSYQNSIHHLARGDGVRLVPHLSHERSTFPLRARLEYCSFAWPCRAGPAVNDNPRREVRGVIAAPAHPPVPGSTITALTAPRRPVDGCTGQRHYVATLFPATSDPLRRAFFAPS